MVDSEKGIKIANALRTDFEIVNGLGYTCIGTFLIGSQNYQIDTENSDIDTRAIVIPKFKDIVNDSKAVNTQHEKTSGDMINIIDFRLFLHYVKNQNPNFVETLFTPYKYIEKDFSYYLSPLFEKREEIARYDIHSACRSIIGCCISNCKLVLKDLEYLGTFSRKELSHAIRYKDMIDSFLDSAAYSDCLIPIHKQLIIDLKEKEVQFNNDFAKNVAETILKNCNNLLGNIPTECNLDTNIEELFNKVKCDMLQYQFMKEFNSEQ